MKRILGSLCLALLLLSGCVSKKKTPSGKDARKKEARASENKVNPGDVMPEDPGETPPKKSRK